MARAKLVKARGKGQFNVENPVVSPGVPGPSVWLLSERISAGHTRRSYPAGLIARTSGRDRLCRVFQVSGQRKGGLYGIIRIGIRFRNTDCNRPSGSNENTSSPPPKPPPTPSPARFTCPP